MRAVVSVLVVSLAAAAATGWWVALRTRSTATESAQQRAALQELQRRLRQFGEEDRVAFGEVQSAVEEILDRRNEFAEPLSPTMVSTLSRARAFLQRFEQRYAMDPAAGIVRAKAYYLAGRIAFEFGQLGEAEFAYRESKRLLGGGGQASSAPRLALGRIETDVALARLQVALGRLDAAEQLYRQIVPLAHTLDAAGELVDRQRAALAAANRSLAVVTAALGGDGTPWMERCIELTEARLSRNVESIGADELLVDSLQVLAELHWRQGRTAAAKQSCLRSLEVLRGLPEKAATVADRTGRTPPTSDHPLAIDRARANLAWLERIASDEVEGAIWHWYPLRPNPAEIVTTDILVHGRLPAEFADQEAILLAWLDRPWAQPVLTQVAAAIWRQVPLLVLVPSDLLEQQAREALEQAGVAADRVRYVRLAADTVWTRDWGPLAINSGGERSAWIDAISTGDLNFPRYRDDSATAELARLLRVPVIHASIFLHGGGILSNGAGLCVVAQSQLDWNRRLGIPDQQLNRTLRRLTGAKQLVYLEPLIDEPTEHLDWFLTFTDPQTVVIGAYQDEDPANGDLLDRHAERMAGLETPSGPLRVRRIPMPPRGTDFFGGTYTNVIYANGVLLVPTWENAGLQNEQALAVFRELMPEWQVVGIECSELGRREGALHCATRNLMLAAP